jgi:hypothetical protein
MTVRAKFTVTSVTRRSQQVPKVDEEGKTTWHPGEVRDIELSPVYGNGDPAHENTKFWQATPSGSIKLSCANAEAAAAFELNREYYVDFSPAE